MPALLMVTTIPATLRALPAALCRPISAPWAGGLEAAAVRDWGSPGFEGAL